MLRFNDRVQAALFSRTRLAQTFPLSDVTKPFRFNAYYEEWQVREAPEGWPLELAGLVADRAPWTLERLRALPQDEQVTRHICIEGWSQIGHWSGPKLSDVLQRAGADLTAKAAGPGMGRAGPAAHPRQARLQERQEPAIDFGRQRRPRRLLGEAGLQLVLRTLKRGRQRAAEDLHVEIHRADHPAHRHDPVRLVGDMQ